MIVFCAQSKHFVNRKVNACIIIHIITVLSYLCCVGEARSGREAGISFVLP
jgi:hypothetical protein